VLLHPEGDILRGKIKAGKPNKFWQEGRGLSRPFFSLADGT
jgi:hypothetical protein